MAVIGVQMYYNSLQEELDVILVDVVQDAPCVGKPIFVEYPYEGEYLVPNECAVQCQEKVQRFIYYMNGQATQCEPNLGCFDTGEDRSITCKPPENIEKLRK